jgi:hypothetical protein
MDVWIEGVSDLMGDELLTRHIIFKTGNNFRAKRIP